MFKVVITLDSMAFFATVFLTPSLLIARETNWKHIFISNAVASVDTLPTRMGHEKVLTSGSLS